MTPEIRTPLETAPETMPSQLAMDIAGGFHIPTYDELTSYGDFVSQFQQPRSSINDRRIYKHTDDAGETISLNESDYRRLEEVAQPQHWLLGAGDRANIATLLEAETLESVPGSGRHRSNSTDPQAVERDAKTLLALQDDARRRLDLHQTIRLAEVVQSSHHGVRLGLNESRPSSEALAAFAAGSLRERLEYVKPAAPLTRKDRELDASLREQRAAQAAKMAQEQPTQSPALLQRLARIFRRIVKLDPSGL